MVRLFRSFAFGLYSALTVMATFVVALAVEPVRRLWPQAFPTAAPIVAPALFDALVDRGANLARRLTVWRERLLARRQDDFGPFAVAAV